MENDYKTIYSIPAWNQIHLCKLRYQMYKKNLKNKREFINMQDWIEDLEKAFPSLSFFKRWVNFYGIFVEIEELKEKAGYA